MEYTLPLLRHSARVVVRQKYLVTFFRCVVAIKLSQAPSKGFVAILHEKKSYKTESLLAHD